MDIQLGGLITKVAYRFGRSHTSQRRINLHGMVRTSL